MKISSYGIAIAACLGATSVAGQQPQVRDEFFWLGEINKATAVINSQEGLLDKSLVPSIAAGITKVIEDGNKPGGKRPALVITFEPLLIEAAGISVTMLHAGRSSQDMIATYRAAMLKDELLDLATQLNRTSNALVTLAERNAGTIVPNYTNGVAAQPNSYGQYLLGHAAGFERDAQRIREAYARIDRSAMGTTVLNGTSWPLNRARMADYLGFAAVVDNAYDAAQISSTEQPVEVGSIVTSIALHTGSFIEDMMTQYAQPRPWILLQEGGGNTYVSSAMPQKRNPGILNATRQDASTAITLALGPMIQAHNLTPGMNDPKESRANGAMVESAVKVLAGLEKILGSLNVDPKRALEELNSDWTASQEIADVMMRKYKIPFREGHHFASEVVTFAKANNIKPLDFPYADAQRIYKESLKDGNVPTDLPMSEQEFRSTLDPVAIINNRATLGGPQPAEMKRMVGVAKQKLQLQEEWIAERKLKTTTSLAKLDADFAALTSQ